MNSGERGLERKETYLYYVVWWSFQLVLLRSSRWRPVVQVNSWHPGQCSTMPRPRPITHMTAYPWVIPDIPPLSFGLPPSRWRRSEPLGSQGNWTIMCFFNSFLESCLPVKGRPGAVARAVPLSHQVVGSKQPLRRFCGEKACLGFSLSQTPLMWEPPALGLPFISVLCLYQWH